MDKSDVSDSTFMSPLNSMNPINIWYKAGRRYEHKSVTPSTPKHQIVQANQPKDLLHSKPKRQQISSSPNSFPALLIINRERVVRRAEVGPRLGHGVRCARVGRVLGQDDGEAGLEVEVDVAVEEPRARVVRLEADRHVVARRGRAGRDDVSPDGVVVVVDGRAGAADDGEGVLSREMRGEHEGGQ